MDRDPLSLTDRHRRDHRQLAIRDFHGLCAGALAFSGQDVIEWRSSTCRWCCPRSSPASFCSVCLEERGLWRVSRQYRHCFVISLDRRRGGLRGDGISAHGPGHASVLRSNRPAAGTRRREAWAPTASGHSCLSLSRLPCLGLSSAASWLSQRRWGNSAPRSHSSRIFQGRHRPYRLRFTLTRKSQAPMKARCGSPSWRS